MPRGNEIPEGVRSAVVDLHKAGKGYKFISKNLDIHHSTVRQIIHKWKRFNTVATLPRSGRPTKNTAQKARRRKVVEDVQAGPADHGEGDPDEKHNIVPDAADADCNSSDAEVSAEDLIVCEVDIVSDEPAHFSGEDHNQEMSDHNIESGECDDDRENSETSQDPMPRFLFARPAEVAEEDSEHEMHRQYGSASSDEMTEENPMDQRFDPNFDGEKKIYGGSSVTVGALVLLLLTFILKHDLSKAATKDLLDLLNIVLPGCIPTSLSFFKNYLTDYKNKTETHLYCSKCANYLGVEPGNKCGVCQQSLNKKVLLEKAFYFLVMPLKVQLRNIFSRVHSKLGEHLRKDASVSDINTGAEFKHCQQEGSITLTFKYDGSPLVNSSKFTIWSILCTINELPYVERCKNVLCHTLWFGKGKPQILSLFTPFINELHKLSHEGLTWKDETGLQHKTKVTAKICISDSLTRSVLQNFQPFSTEFGCGFCYHKGELVQKGRGYTRVYPVQTDGCDLRHMAETEQLAELVIENGYPQGQMGVKGQSTLFLLPSFDIIKGFVPDYMYCFCLGVVPEFVNLWFDPLFARMHFHLSPEHLNDLDSALCAIQPPDEIKHSPRRLSERMHWEASEWRAFALLYSPVMLKNVLPTLFYEHWMLLICAFHTLLSQFATQDELSCAELCLSQFVAQVPSLYGLEHCSFNCHLLTHLTESARDWGLLWANSAFVFQDVNSRLLERFSSTKSVTSQMFQQFFSYQEVIRKGSGVLKDASTEVKDFFCSMTSCNILNQSSNYIREHVMILGCGSPRSLTATEVAALQNADTCRVIEFKGFVYKNMLVTSLEHSATCKRNNSVIETTSGFALVESVVVVQKPCSCERTSSCSCRELVVFCKKLLRANGQPTLHIMQINRNLAEFLAGVKISDELCAVTCEDIVSKCFAIELEGSLFVMRMPVFEIH